MEELLVKVKQNLILDHAVNDAPTQKTPCLRPQNRLSSCWHPTFMSPGTAVQAASLRIVSRLESRCGRL